MSKHTPGPWTTKRGTSQMVSTDTTVAALSDHADDGARYWIFSPADGHGDRAADAALIAAAPEMLEALKRWRDRPSFRREDYEAACAAIAKAEGR
jgi:hypothetical protein